MPLIMKGFRQAMQAGPAVLYLHPWELDEGTPRVGLSRIDHFITYFNIGEPMRRRLTALIDAIDFMPMWEALSAEDWK